MRAMKPTDFLQGVAYGAGGGGGAAPSGSVEITQNGTYNVAGKAQAVVDVPNTYGAADEGKVVSSGALVAQTQKQITANGTHDTTNNNSVVVNVPSSQPVLVTKNITENGTYTASDDQADGYSEVTVNVSGGGGGLSWAKVCAKDFDKDIDIDLSDTTKTSLHIRSGTFNSGNATSLYIHGQGSVTECAIEIGAFSYNTMTSVICAANLWYINETAFSDCTITGTAQFANLWAPYGVDDDINGIGYAAFKKVQCNAMKFGNVRKIGTSAFESSSVQTLDFGVVRKINANAFKNAYGLSTLIFRTNDTIELVNTNALSTTGIGEGLGYIYVPSSLLNSFKTATNWSTFASQFRALESYTVDGTTTGELDPTKI